MTIKPRMCLETQPGIPESYEPLLAKVERPGRYIGGEMNSVVKNPDRLRATIALAFPDLYDLGMSYHGFRILYETVNARDDFAAERVFAPWPDFADALRAAKLPLTTLETFRPLREIEIIGFTLQHELLYTNVLEMLDLGGIPVRASDRAAAGQTFPVVIAGGEGAYSPEPMADFIDAFVLGDGEEVVLELLEEAASVREKKLSRAELLRRLAALPGVYVPSLYEVRWHKDGKIKSVRPATPDAPPEVRPRSCDIAKNDGSVRPVVPLIRTVQDRTVVEIRRGCVHGCRFCHGGMITRPVRERPVEQILDIVRRNLAETGDSEVSLLSLSAADYTEILPLVRRLNAELAPRRVSISLPSLRISSFDVALAAEISRVRKSGFTFAPEAGSERLRRVINKPLDENDFLDVIGHVWQAGWKTVKMYFMIGLPTETEEDLDGIARIAASALDRAREAGIRGAMVHLTLSPFVPKPHTPFQWEGQLAPEELRRRIFYVRDRLPRRGVEVKTSSLESSALEAVLARGDRRMGAVIESAWRAGARFDAWRETFHPNLWNKAFADAGIAPAWYAERARDQDEIFPYDHLVAPPGKRYLAEQRDAARREETTPDCMNNPCSRCDACVKPKQHHLARNSKSPTGDDPQKEKKPPHAPETPPESPPVMRVRLRFTKKDRLRFIAHLDFAEAIHRIIRRSGAPIAHSQGFNPQPRIALSPPLPLGFEGWGETADVFLLKRISLREWLEQLRSLSAPAGLEWTGIEEIPLKAPSVQEAATQYRYHIAWRLLETTRESEENAAPTVLPLAQKRIETALARFLESASCPIEILRKGKLQKRDARAFVAACACVPPPDDFGAALEMTLHAQQGASLSPLIILEAIFGENPEQGVLLRTARLPIEV